MIMKFVGPIAFIVFNIFMRTTDGQERDRVAMMIIYYQIVTI